MITDSEPNALAGVSEQILDVLAGNDYSREDIFAVHLALEEALMNAFKHGNKMDRTKKVRVVYEVGPKAVQVEVTDEGSGFDPGAVPDPRCGDNIFKPEGRGLLLMQSYMDVVEYNDTGNGVRMVRYRGRQTAPQNEETISGS